MSSLIVEQSGPVVRVTLNRPDVRNALNEQMIAELTAWARSVPPSGPSTGSGHPSTGSGQEVRVAVLAGAGTSFCAGADLTWMSRMVSYSFDENVDDAMAIAAMFNALDRLPIPLIGRVHGAALGGGSGLAAVCDIVVAADDAAFGFTEARLGIVPAVISPFVVQKIGVSAARELFLTASRFTSVRAKEIGLAHAVVPESGLDAAIDGYVRELLASAPGAITQAKELIAAVASRSPAAVAELTAQTIARQRVSAEGQDGMRAFLEKRKPGWVE